MSDISNPFEAVLAKRERLERALVRYAHLTLAATSPADLLTLVCACDATINALHVRPEFQEAQRSQAWRTLRYFASSFLHFSDADLP